MKTAKELKETPHLCIKELGEQGLIGWVDFPDLKFTGTVIAGFNEGGYEHVSVSSRKKTQLPSWDVMCRLKDMFWRKDEDVIQIHPKEEEYIHGVGMPWNRLDNVLHLWRPADGDWSILNKEA